MTLRLALLSVAVAVFSAPLSNAHGTSAAPDDGQTVSLEEEQVALSNLPVTDRWGRRGGFRDMVGRDQAVIISFSYTECESLCNITNAVLSVVDQSLVERPQPDLRIVTVGIDPRRDTSAALDAEARSLSASDNWLWLAGGLQGTRPLLDLLRFPPGALEDHDPIFLIGRPCRGLFTRVVGLPDPDKLLDLASHQPPCTD